MNRVDIHDWKWVNDRKNLQDGLAKAGVEYGREWAARVKIVSQAKNVYEVAGVPKIEAEEAKQLYDRGVPFVDVGRLYDACGTDIQRIASLQFLELLNSLYHPFESIRDPPDSLVGLAIPVE